ncbi:MAG: sulfur carrier protein ThiS [Chthoniobacterales bacterium]|nr:sulfur carrier protein ThiS [Chthoniobacterales bacterium]
MKRLAINGEERHLHADTLVALLAELQLPESLVLVELNGVALLRSEWTDRRLCDGDKIEILQVSAGG